MGRPVLTPSVLTAIYDAAAELAREDGCTCDVEIVLTRVDGGTVSVQWAHDDVCPALLRYRAPRN